jgi:group I intron endonuclease
MIKCKLNNKVYIGSSKNIERRWKEHILSLNKNDKRKCNKNLQNDWNEFGRDSFEFIILEECLPQFLFRKENKWIKECNSRHIGYNINTAYYNRAKH